MKKVLFAMVLLTAAISLSAQVTVYKLEGSESNQAYSVPSHVQINFTSTNPTITNANWMPVDNMWRATFTQDNRITRIYYNPLRFDNTSEQYRVVLPVINTYVPEEVITAAINAYGTSLYDITRVMTAADSL